MKILVFGSLNIDMVYEVQKIVSAGKTVSARSLNRFSGGKGFNQAIAAARAGAQVSLAGMIGTDGLFLKELADSEGIDTTLVKTIEGESGHAIIQVDEKGENCIIVYGGANRKIDTAFADRVLAGFERGDILVLQNEISCLGYIVDKAFEKGMLTVLNMSPVTEELKRIDVSRLYCLLVNETEAADCFGTETPEAFAEAMKTKYPQLCAVMTLGAGGSLCIKDGYVYTAPAFNVKAVDTTAAGDTFTGYFISELTHSTPPDRALRLANCAAAIAVSRQGAAPSIPKKEEVTRLIKDMKPLCKTERERKKETVLKYINDDIKNATLKGAAERLGYSAVYAGQTIKDCFGIGFSELLGSLRCKAAAEMLADTDLPIGEIISRVGYTNENRFRILFSKQYGCLPLEYRKRQKDVLKK